MFQLKMLRSIFCYIVYVHYYISNAKRMPLSPTQNIYSNNKRTFPAPTVGNWYGQDKLVDMHTPFEAIWKDYSGIQPQNSYIGTICSFVTFFGSRLYIWVQKVTTHPFPDNLQVHSNKVFCWYMNWLGNDLK